MIITLESKSTTEPVSLAEAKKQLRISTAETAHDDVLAIYIAAARRTAENITKRELTTATRKLILDGFPANNNAIELPRAPLSTDDSTVGVKIDYVNPTGGTTNLATSVYTVDSDSEPGRIYTQYDQEWPDTYDIRKAVTITYKCGYASASFPENIKHWILLRVGAAFEHREAVITDENGRFNYLGRDYMDGLLDEHIIRDIGV